MTIHGHMLRMAIAAIGREPPIGEAIFDVPGTYNWVVPPGVYSVSVVCVGGGGGAGWNFAYHTAGAGGGALRWASNIPVTPGQVIPIVVGAPGLGGKASSVATNGGDSSFNGNVIARGGGRSSTGDPAGAGGGAGGTHSGTGGGTSSGGGNGGNGGNGGTGQTAGGTAGGGGGAGGYSGPGGRGRIGAPIPAEAPLPAPPGSGAGGGGAGSGGGVGIFGKGNDGAVGSPGSWYPGTSLPQYGAGASGVPNQYNGPDGGPGVVRIVWGAGREFPSTNVGPTELLL